MRAKSRVFASIFIVKKAFPLPTTIMGDWDPDTEAPYLIHTRNMKDIRNRSSSSHTYAFLIKEANRRYLLGVPV